MNASDSRITAPPTSPDRSRFPRVRPVNRTQLCWRTVDVERLVEEDHPARAIREFVGRLDLTRFLAPIGSLLGQAGRPAFDPQLLISLWLYASSRGLSSAREIARHCEYEPAFQWLTGLDVVNHHTLSDFRGEQREALALRPDGTLECKWWAF